MITQSFYHYVQIFRNADLLESDQQAQFAELVFLDGVELVDCKHLACAL